MHPDRRQTVAERVGNQGRLPSRRSVWLVFRCDGSHPEVFGSADAAAKVVGACAVEEPHKRCRMERFVPASMRTRTVKEKANAKR